MVEFFLWAAFILIGVPLIMIGAAFVIGAVVASVEEVRRGD